MISPIHASQALLPGGNSFLRQATKIAASTESPSDTVTLSAEARQRLNAEAATPSASSDGSAWRLSGEVRRFSDLLEIDGRQNLVAIQLTEAQIAESKRYEQEMAAREQANAAYAAAHPYPVVGQVFANGKAVATVYEGGGYALTSALPGLSSGELSPQARLAEIASKTKGNIVYGGSTTSTGVYGPGAPESELPPITARSLSQIFEQDIAPLMEALRQRQA